MVKLFNTLPKATLTEISKEDLTYAPFYLPKPVDPELAELRRQRAELYKKYLEENPPETVRKPRDVQISSKELSEIKSEIEKEQQARLLLITTNLVIVELVQETSIEVESRPKKDGIWDFGIEDEIPFFDISCSYELTGYRPINETEGLDFKIEPFIEVQTTYKKLKKYTEERKGSLEYNKFWAREYKRMREGMRANGYTITGDHYYFLNYYQMMTTDDVQYAGQGRNFGSPSFYVALYEYFHYVELCKRLGKNCVSLKGRGLGWSEITAAIVVNTFESKAETRCLVTAALSDHLEKTLAKCWALVNHCNENTDGGLFKPLGANRPDFKKTYVEETSTKVKKGWLSEIEGVIADKPDKVRGDRCEIVVLEEIGSNPVSKKSFIQGEALVTINGRKVGLILGLGTGKYKD